MSEMSSSEMDEPGDEVRLVVTPKTDLKLVDTLAEAIEIVKEIEVEQTERYVLECCPKEFGSTGYINVFSFFYLTIK